MITQEDHRPGLVGLYMHTLYVHLMRVYHGHPMDEIKYIQLAKISVGHTCIDPAADFFIYFSMYPYRRKRRQEEERDSVSQEKQEDSVVVGWNERLVLQRPGSTQANKTRF